MPKIRTIQIAGQRLGEIEKMDYYAWEFGQAKVSSIKLLETFSQMAKLADGLLTNIHNYIADYQCKI